MKKYTKEYQKRNPKISRIASRKYYWANREMVLAKKSKQDKTPEGRIKNLQVYYKHRLSKVMSKRIRDCLKVGKKGNSWKELVDYTYNDLKTHLELQFQNGMSWDNYGKWHIDHKRPVSSFNITSFECNDFKECWSLENLQPLWAIDNLKKGAYYNG